MAFWNKKKNEEEASGDIKKNGSLSEDLSAEMQAINEAFEEEQAEKEAKAKALAEAAEKEKQKLLAVEEQVRNNASGYIKESQTAKDTVAQKFFMLVETTPDYLSAEGNNILVEGMVYGSASKGDEIFLYNTDNEIITSNIVSIRTEPDVTVDSIESSRAVLELRSADVKEVKRFAVVTNAVPDQIADKKTITNPMVLGLSLDFNRFSRDTDYFTVLINAIIRAEFLTHGKIDKAENGKARIGIISLQDNNEPGKRLIPVFTDRYTMSKAKIDTAGDKITTIALKFPDLARFASADEHEGFVINPFGPTSIKIPKALVLEILNNESYKKEADSLAGKIKVENQKIHDKTQIFIGVPPENSEYKSITRAVVKYCKTNPSIKKVGIVMKMEKGKKEASYLCIVDCPKNVTNDCYTGIFAAVKPFLNIHKKMDFMRYEETVFADDYFAKQKLVYEA